jgi:hypothetical protein
MRTSLQLSSPGTIETAYQGEGWRRSPPECVDCRLGFDRFTMKIALMSRVPRLPVEV